MADFFSKPLQGKLFNRFRDMIMGITPVPPVEDPSLGSNTTAQERVESSVFCANEQRTDDEPLADVKRTNGRIEPKKVTWADRVKEGLTQRTETSN